MRLRIRASFWLAICAAMPLVAQPVPPAPKPSPAAGRQARTGAHPAKPAAPLAPANVLDATSLGSPILLDKDWRIGITSDPNASASAFDDSGWAVRNAQASVAEVPDPESSSATPSSQRNLRRYVWFRLHIQLAPNHGPLALFIELPVSRTTSYALGSPGITADVFANGSQIQPEGPNGSDPQHYQQISRIYNLNVRSGGYLAHTRHSYDLRPFGYAPTPHSLPTTTFPSAIRATSQRGLNLWSDRNLFERSPAWFTPCFLPFWQSFCFALYFTQKGHIEYLWLALHELVQAPIGFVELAGSSARIDSSGTRRWFCSSSSSRPISSSSFSSRFSPCAAAGTSHCSATRRRSLPASDPPCCWSATAVPSACFWPASSSAASCG